MTDNILPKGLGWRPDVPDIRDEEFMFSSALARELRSEDEIPRNKIVPWRFTKTTEKNACDLPNFDQGTTSSCTGQSVGGLIDLVSGLQPRSRLLLYWYGREAIGETDNDNGAYIRDVIKGAVKKGAGAEKYWPFSYDRVTVRPSGQILESAAKHKVRSYHRLQGRRDFLSCLANGYPFVIGFTCYEEFMSENGTVKHGILNLPETDGRNYGGHAVTVIGYDLDFMTSDWGREAAASGIRVPREVYIVRNSWGENWGRQGDFAVDCAYFENTYLADDSWTVRC